MTRRPVGQYPKMSLTCDTCKTECCSLNGPTHNDKWVCDSCNITPEQTVEESDSDSDEDHDEDHEHKCESCKVRTYDVFIHPFGCVALCEGCIGEDTKKPQCPRGYEDGACDICEDLWDQLDKGIPWGSLNQPNYDSDEKAGGL